MKNFRRLALLSLVSLTFTHASVAFANSSLPNHRHISVTGQAELQAMPDTAVLHLSVQSMKQTSLDAKKDLDQRVNRLLDGLTDFGIAESQVSASNIATEAKQNYNRGEPAQVLGYIARRNIKVTLTQLDKLNDFMNFVLSVNINAIRNIELKSSKEQQLQQEVNNLAVKNAKNKGQALANAFGTNLGAIYSINASSNHSFHRYGANNEAYPTSARMADSMAKAGRYLQENIVFTASISVVFDLEL
ncbi:hypothetical protein SAMN05216262_11654 [Colwellia chukchiensis]|uniref:SIMPL domain-containing protein n=1 Tax=Colwellia chukchiensis TaxID=641665 RepID=A0A1H7RYL2_9GAMM|nr:SIMPL domain-containing protein [Colwellia chukchiensis]SEL65119.1 hypothetical protein SAMN05216262_11654 [Colwellia chukchiensis]